MFIWGVSVHRPSSPSEIGGNQETGAFLEHRYGFQDESDY